MCCSVAKSCPTPCHIVGCAHPGFPVLYYLPEFALTLVHWVSDAIQPSHPLSPPSLPALNLSQHQSFFAVSQLFTSGGQSIGASGSVIPMNVQVWSPCSARDTQESSSTSQFKSINSLVLTFFMVQLTHPYITTGKTIAFSLWTFVSKVISLLFNMLCRFVLAFLSRTMHLLISWLQSPFTVIFGAHKNKTCYCFNFFPFYFPWSDETRCHYLSFWMLNSRPAFSFSCFHFHQEAL